jgi:hypothetical protein
LSIFVGLNLGRRRRETLRRKRKSINTPLSTNGHLSVAVPRSSMAVLYSSSASL